MSGRNTSKLFHLGSLVVIAFVAEGILSKGDLPVVGLGFVTHMMGTAGLFVALFVCQGFNHTPVRKEAVNSTLRTIRTAILILCAWALACSFFQSPRFLAANVLFWSFWAVNLYVIWWVVPSLLGDLSSRDRVKLLLFIQGTVVCLCVLMHPRNGYQQGRLVGMFVNASHSGRMMALATISLFAVWLTSREKRRWVSVMLPVALLLLLMTRTRASIGASLIGCTAVFLTSQLASHSWRQTSVRHKTGVLVAVVFLAAVGAYQTIDSDEAATFLRVSGGIQKVLAGRAMNWSQGYGDFGEYGLAGQGFMSRFGDTENPTKMMGIEIPRYDWRTADDPMNMWMSIAKQSGFVAMILLAVIVICLYKLQAGIVHLPSRCIMLGFLTAGLVFGSFDGNWLLSFGHPVDRLCMVTFAMLASVSPPGRRSVVSVRPHARLSVSTAA
ncbi:MAG: hypothetical protein ABJZ55_19970 [Fuerstiella sp.]